MCVARLSSAFLLAIRINLHLSILCTFMVLYVNALSVAVFMIHIHNLFNVHTYVYMYVSIYPFLYVGNPGPYLIDTGSVYISRDGGLSWEQVRIATKLCTYVCNRNT